LFCLPTFKKDKRFIPKEYTKGYRENLSKFPFDFEPYQEQTEIKHKVFGDYFDKWVKILGAGCGGKLNYIDGFAGLGAYGKNGEIHYGSPVIAAEVIRKNNRFVYQANLTLIDVNPNVLENLHKVLEYKGLLNCKGLEFNFINQDFNEAINNYMRLPSNRNLAPTFAFIDPFGFEGIHFQTIKNIMEQASKPEVIINFMYNAITRFLERPDLKETFSRVFGTNEWERFLHLEGEREQIIIEYYVSKLKQISKFVFPYRLTFPDKKRTYYYLIHLTNHHLGASIMKSSFAKYSLGRVEWLGEESAQTSLADIIGINMNSIKDLLLKRYNKKSVSFKQIIVDNIDTTPYLESQLRDSLKELEKDGMVHIERTPKLGQKERPLTSIQPDSEIYFNCMPSIERKTLLYETKVEYGNFTINHVFGCAHGCKYPCYAFLMARSYGKAKDYETWIHPRIVTNALELLEKEIPKYKAKIDFVHLSFTTDPFMFDNLNERPYALIEDLTLKIIRRLNAEGIKVTVLTKGLYPKELCNVNCFNSDNEYGITLVSLNEKFKKNFEPFAAPIEERIKSIEYLHNKGLKTWVSIEPYPTPNIIKQDIEKILSRIAFVDKIIFGKMNYNKEATGYSENENFYKDCTQKVIAFCESNGKQYHIKKGTPNADATTCELFKNEQ
jgi:three-Cys-motif partner protein